MFHVTCTGFLLPGAGAPAESCEDAVWPRGVHSEHCPVFRCAVADGAYGTFNSGLWAQAIVDTYVKERQLFADARSEWKTRVAAVSVSDPFSAGNQSVAFAAFVGLTLERTSDLCSFRATAIGDCSLFQFDMVGQLKASFPFADSRQLQSDPQLVCTGFAINEHLVLTQNGIWEPGDSFYLASDGFSSFIFNLLENHENPFHLLNEIDDDADFAAIVEQGRRRRNQMNEPYISQGDVALLRVVPS